MSDILVKNMEMPKACGDCPFFKRGSNPMGEDFIFAQPWGDYLVSGEENVIEHDISMDCPLVAVPPHGRLIDADKLLETLAKHSYPSQREWYFAEVGQFIDEAETIVEATE